MRKFLCDFAKAVRFALLGKKWWNTGAKGGGYENKKEDNLHTND